MIILKKTYRKQNKYARTGVNGTAGNRRHAKKLIFIYISKGRRK
jgi:hypothetical protein